MTESPAIDWKLRGPPRPPGAPLARPRSAATLIVLRDDAAKPRVLMGKRHAGHKFMPNLWVFPGGRVDRADYHAPFATDLQPAAASVFAAHIPPGRGRALALAAVRETFEEAGLLLARPAEPRPLAGPWRDFAAQGAAADLAALEIVGRAITPPFIARRFDTWFLMTSAERLVSLERQADCGELDEIAWVDLDEALALPLSGVTRKMLAEAVARLDDPERPRLFMRDLHGGPRPTVL